MKPNAVMRGHRFDGLRNRKMGGMLLELQAVEHKDLQVF